MHNLVYRFVQVKNKKTHFLHAYACAPLYFGLSHKVPIKHSEVFLIESFHMLRGMEYFCEAL